ncbi:MAG: VWA domain-containing protein [Rikenellaceae bacterium]|nr:VWA domain-containing protein [Rikenellaceae bacterium]
MVFANPNMLWLLAVIVPMVGWYVWRQLKGGASLRLSTTDTFARAHHTAKYYLRHLPFVLQCAAVALLIVALARPQSTESGTEQTTRGIDIVLALDVSGSMLARDFTPDRVAAAKDVAARFINDRRGDRIGLVVFAGESFTQSPLTTDKATLLNLLSKVETGMIEDGTAIGNGLATSINRLRESDAVSKVVILLTDGVNNAGQIAPLTAAEIAKTLGIKVYTVGVGTRGNAPYPMRDMWGNVVMQSVPVEIDEGVLTQIATMTGGQYFRATDKKALIDIYDQINSLETTEIETNDYTLHHEHYAVFALWALGLLVVAFLLNALLFRQIP